MEITINGEPIKPHVFTDEEGRFMNGVLDKINAIIWESHMCGLPIPGDEIMKQLNAWAEKV
jgi:hypothetical protein